jgi:hypothetical protein
MIVSGALTGGRKRYTTTAPTFPPGIATTVRPGTIVELSGIGKSWLEMH